MRSRLTPPMRGALILILIGGLIIGFVWVVVNEPDSSSDSATESTSVGPGPVTHKHVGSVDAPEELTTVFIVPGGVIGVALQVGTTAGYYPRVRPPAGGVLVAASLSQVVGGTAPVQVPDPPSPGLDPDDLPGSRIWLRAGDFRAPLFTDVRAQKRFGRGEEASRLVAVPKTDQPIRLELELDGRRQSVDPRSGRRTTGAFAALYRPQARDRDDRDAAGSSATATGAQRSGDLGWETTARADYRRVPYLAGLGWAKAGREWLVLDEAELRVTDIVDPRTDGTRPPFETIKIGRTKASKGEVTAPGVRVVRGSSTGPLTAGSTTYGEESGTGNPQVARYRASYLVLEVPEGAATRLTYRLQTPLAPPRRTTLHAQQGLMIPASPYASDRADG